jgi:hypothetical protein
LHRAKIIKINLNASLYLVLGIPFREYSALFLLYHYRKQKMIRINTEQKILLEIVFEFICYSLFSGRVALYALFWT